MCVYIHINIIYLSIYIIISKKIKFIISIEHMQNQKLFNYYKRLNLRALRICERLTSSDQLNSSQNCSKIPPMKAAVFSQLKILQCQRASFQVYLDIVSDVSCPSWALFHHHLGFFLLPLKNGKEVHYHYTIFLSIQSQ